MRKGSRVKKVLLIILIVLLVLIAAAATTFFVINKLGKDSLTADSDTVEIPDAQPLDNSYDTIKYKGHTYQFNKNVVNILCIGVDRYSYNPGEKIGEGGMADALFIISRDTSAGTTKIIQISRDSLVDVNIYNTSGEYVETIKTQICRAFSYGDGEQLSIDNTIRSVERLFYGLSIDSYIVLSRDGIAAVNDALGGIELTALDTIPGYTTKGDDVLLMGDAVEKYMTYRDVNVLDSNLNRMERQKQYIGALGNKLIQQCKSNIKVPVDIYNSTSKYTKGNLNASKITYLVTNMVTVGNSRLEFKTVEGKVIDYVTEELDNQENAGYEVDNEKLMDLFIETYYIQID